MRPYFLINKIPLVNCVRQFYPGQPIARAWETYAEGPDSYSSLETILQTWKITTHATVF